MKFPDKQVKEIDLPELQETFADSMGISTVDGTGARITFCVTRMDPPTPPQKPTAKRYPACRLVLPIEALVDLFNHLNNLVGALEKQGLVKREGPKIISQAPEGKPN